MKMRELFQFARGFEAGWFESIDLSGLTYADGTGFGMEEIFPHGLSIAGDGLGNYWMVDLTSESTNWGPIFYASHDAPVVVFQAENVFLFQQRRPAVLNKPWKGDVNDVLERFTDKIWKENPRLLSYAACGK